MNDVHIVNVLVGIVTAVFISAASSWVTVQLSLRRFRTEKWWENRANAYARVIEALHNARAYASAHLNAEYRGHHLPEEREKDLEARERAAQDEIRKATDLGAFLFCRRAVECLNAYQAETDRASRSECWHEFLELNLAATAKCMKDITEIAREDLHI